VATLRAFIALSLSEAARAAVAERRQQLARQLSGVRWTPPDQWHLTLHFFGELPEDQVEMVRAVMLSIGHRTAPFALALGAPGGFPSLARPRVVWLGFSDPAALCRLQADLGRQLQAGGLTLEDRPFRPHLTLGRLRQPRSLPPLPPELLAPLAVTVPVERMLLFASRLGPQGAVHSLLADVSLSGPDGPPHT